VLDAAQALACAFRFQERLDEWPAHIDPSWREGRIARHLMVFAEMSELARRRAALVVYQRWCGPLPQPGALVLCGGALGLCGRDELLARLCSLALALRPGVLRCCVDGRVREMFRRALGESFELLRAQVQGGRPVPARVARLEPLTWACVGYRDAVRAGLLPARGLRRLVRLALPRYWPEDMHADDLAAAGVQQARVAAALEQVVLLRGGAPW
jgi:Bacterial type III secretion protein (HrpB4)